MNVTHFSDPGCPWAWSAGPALAVLHWRYGDQLAWRLVMIGLSEDSSSYQRRGYTGEGVGAGRPPLPPPRLAFPGPPRRSTPGPRDQPHGTWPMCRVVVAARRLVPDRQWSVFRALQFAQFTSAAALDDP